MTGRHIWYGRSLCLLCIYPFANVRNDAGSRRNASVLKSLQVSRTSFLKWAQKRSLDQQDETLKIRDLQMNLIAL